MGGPTLLEEGEVPEQGRRNNRRPNKGPSQQIKTPQAQPPSPNFSHSFTPSDPALLLTQATQCPINKLSLRGAFLALPPSLSLSPNFYSFFMSVTSCLSTPCPPGSDLLVSPPPTVHLLPATHRMPLCPELCTVFSCVFASCYSKAVIMEIRHHALSTCCVLGSV